MNTFQLQQSLETQLSYLNMLLDSGKYKQKALIGNDMEALQKSLLREEQLLNNVISQGENISVAIKNLAAENSLGIIHPSLSEFLNYVNEEKDTNVKVIKMLQNSIKEMVEKVSITNNQNMTLINHARSFIKEMITNLVGLSKKQILDAKV